MTGPRVLTMSPTCALTLRFGPSGERRSLHAARVHVSFPRARRAPPHTRSQARLGFLQELSVDAFGPASYRPLDLVVRSSRASLMLVLRL